ncbi:MAG: hypothetical protein MUC58_04640 [Rhizobiaceae bacterium]|jgi:hypothetical protein|nr:hypothetical protein [Rhizobiaceae bacterium]
MAALGWSFEQAQKRNGESPPAKMRCMPESFWQGLQALQEDGESGLNRVLIVTLCGKTG